MKKQFTNKARYLGLKLTAIIFALLLFASGQSWGQTSTQNFGIGTGSHTSTTGSTSFITNPTSGTTWARAGGSGSINLVSASNPLSTLGSYVRGVASTSTAVSKFSPWVGYTGGTEFYTSFKVLFGDASAGTTATSGSWSFYQGAGAMYSDANDFAGAQVFTGLRFTYGSGGSLALTYRGGSSWINTGLSPNSFSSATVYTIEIVGNNKTSGTISYTYNGAAQTVAVQKFDLYINGTKIGDDLAEAALPANTSVVSGTFIGISSTSNVANIFVDDAVTYNAVPATIGSGSSAPSVTSSAATAISTTTATLNGNVTSDGGATINERGFVYKTSAGVTISDNKTTVSGTTGAYTLSPTLTAGQQYFFKAYAINSVGTTFSSPELSFYTLSNEPTAHASSFSASAASQTQIDLTFSAATTIPASGYLILQKTGSAPTGLPVDATAYTVGNTIGDGTVAAIITNTVDISKSITGLSAGTQYYFTLFPYNGSASTINYKTDGSVPSANATTTAPLNTTSKVEAPATQILAGNVASTITTSGSAVDVFKFKISDLGPDAAATKVTTVKITKTGTAVLNTTVSGAELWNGGTQVATATTTVNLNDITFTIVSGNLDVADVTSTELTLKVWLSSTVTDNSTLIFSVPQTLHGFTADAVASTFATDFGAAVTGNTMTITVEATKLAFVQQPTNASPNVAMTPAVTVKATDVNNNIDLDYVTDINITSSGTLTGSPVAVTPASGIATFSTLTHTALGNNFTLNAASGTLSNAISNNFSISSLLLVEDFDYTNGALLTANGWSAHSTGGSQAIDVVVPGLTFNGYVGSGVGGAAKVDNTGEDLNKTFTPKTSGSIYAAFIISASATNNAGYFFHLAQDNILNTTYVSRVWINATGTSVGIGTSATVAISANTPTLLVVKYNIDTKLSSLYVLNSMSATEPSTADATFTETATLTNVGAVCLRQYNASQNILVDGIRVTTSWSDLAIAFSGTGEWSNSSLWNTGAVPAANESVLINGDASITGNVEVAGLTINSGKSLTVNVGKQLTVTGATTLNGTECLVLKSDVNGTASFINNGTISGSGTAKVERYITNDNKWHFLSSPVAAQLIKPNFAPNTCDETFDFYKWDASADLTAPTSTPWVNLRATATTYEQTFETNFAVGRGYLVAYSSSYGGSETHQFTGTLNSGDKSIGVVYDVNNKFNLIGNPFPSAINWGNVTKTDLASQYAWIYNENISDYTEISTGTIAPMQGFFVEVNPAVTTFTIPNSVRTHDASTFLKTTTANTNEVSLKFSNDTKWGTTRIQFLANATTGKDWYDALKLFSMNTAIPQVYTTISTGQKFAVNALPELNANTTVPVSIYVPANGNFSITTDGLANLSNCTSVILEDLKTNTTQNLMQNPVYNFTATTTDNANRFVLHFATSVGVNEIGKTNGGIYAYDNNIYVNTNEQIKQISVYNAMGQLIKTVNNVNGLQKINMNGNASGYYIVKVICDKNVYSEKVLIK